MRKFVKRTVHKIFRQFFLAYRILCIKKNILIEKKNLLNFFGQVMACFNTHIVQLLSQSMRVLCGQFLRAQSHHSVNLHKTAYFNCKNYQVQKIDTAKFS